LSFLMRDRASVGFVPSTTKAMRASATRSSGARLSGGTVEVMFAGGGTISSAPGPVLF
jgi:hypothetical protein